MKKGASVESSDQPLNPGTVLDDRFCIEQKLGGGSFGDVYRATQLVCGRSLRRVALKLFKSDAVQAGNVTEVFSDAMTLLSLQDEFPDPAIARHLVEVYDMGVLRDSGRAFMSMKLIPGRRTFQNAVHRHVDFGMRVKVSLGYLRQLLVPLAWMHTRDPAIVHGDLKPDNVLWHEETLILTDFGLSARMPRGVRGGAIAYQAAETLTGQPGGPATDIFAVGVMWYEMLARQHPFANVGEDATAAGDQRGYAQAHLQARSWPIAARGAADDDRRIVPVSEHNPELRENPRLEAIMHRCLAALPTQRYADAQQLLDEVDAFEAGSELAGTHTVREAPQAASQQLARQQLEMHLADAEAYLKQGDCERARQALDGDLPAGRMHRAWVCCRIRVLARMQKFDEAKTACQHADEQWPKDPDVLNAKADLYAAMGRHAQAHSLRQMSQRLQVRRG